MFYALSQYLGDEVVVLGASEGKENPKFLLLSEVRKPGLKDFLQKTLKEICDKSSLQWSYWTLLNFLQPKIFRQISRSFLSATISSFWVRIWQPSASSVRSWSRRIQNSPRRASGNA